MGRADREVIEQKISPPFWEEMLVRAQLTAPDKSLLMLAMRDNKAVICERVFLGEVRNSMSKKGM